MPGGGRRSAGGRCERGRSGRFDEVAPQEQWHSGVRIDQILESVPEADRGDLLGRLLQCELQLRRTRGEAPGIGEYVQAFPDHKQTIERNFETSCTPHSASNTTIHHTVSEQCATEPQSETVGTQIGRYQLLELIGRGFPVQPFPCAPQLS